MTSLFFNFYNRRNNILPGSSSSPLAFPNKEEISEILGIPFDTQSGEKRPACNGGRKRAADPMKVPAAEMDKGKTTGAMKETGHALGLPVGHKIEAFDHSHIQGPTQSARWLFVDGEPAKKLYRKYISSRR